jgi:hypothetical protein
MFETRISGPKGLHFFYGVLCVSLAFMVFAWGTNYKLSLYKVGHESSPAKVCTRGSDAAKSAFEHVVDARDVAHAHLSTAALFFLPQEIGDQSLDRLSNEAVIDRSPLSRAPILYLRPPPDQRVSFG